jgi:NAD(P)-dependent dehydrogenase (short-subunit alcohol dehydrogenase family)
MGQLDGKIAIITGGGTGIGKGIGRAFAREGANLVIAARRQEHLISAAEEFRELGAQVETITTDVTDEDQVRALFEATMSRFGKLDLLVNNSGAFDGGPIEDISLDTWQKVIGVNLTGVFLCTREAMGIMKKQNGGRIINIGSISAQVPRMDSSPYTTSKHGLVGLTKSTALEGRAFNISAGCLHPGNTSKEFSQSVQDAEPMMNVDELASVALAMAALPAHVSVLDAIVLPYRQDYVGRG